jgi:hypothetical protein
MSEPVTATMPENRAIPGYDWTGLYAGGHFGYSRGQVNPAILDISRITGTAGKFIVTDFFDTNGYAQDPGTDFSRLGHVWPRLV